MFTLVKQGVKPVWRVDSWNSNFAEQLKNDGVTLGDSPPEITLAEVGGEPQRDKPRRA
jgi:hypothetical protein